MLPKTFRNSRPTAQRFGSQPSVRQTQIQPFHLQASSAALMAHPLPSDHPTTPPHNHNYTPSSFSFPAWTHRRGRLDVRAGCVGVSRKSYLAPGLSDEKVLCGHQPQSKPHLSEPGTHQRTWRVMGRPYRQADQTLSMTRRNDRIPPVHPAAPAVRAIRKKKSPQATTQELSIKSHPTRSRNF